MDVPRELRTMRNNMGKIPIDVFYDEHKKLSEEIKDAAKGIAESGMLLAALVATVAFAAALTVSGEKTNAWFTVFILTNAVALFTSSVCVYTLILVKFHFIKICRKRVCDITTTQLDFWACVNFYLLCCYGCSFYCSLLSDI